MCSFKEIAKFILGLFNFIFVVVGLSLLAVGIIAKVRPEYINVLFILGKITGISKVPAAFDLGGIITASAIVMIILGGAVAGVGFFGCCGACHKNRPLLIIYIFVLVVVLLAHLALIIFAAVAPEKLKGTIQETMQKSMSEFKEDITLSGDGTLKLPNDPVSLGWTLLQIEANCCGTYDYTDYKIWPHKVVVNGRTRSAAVPISCCAKTKELNLEKSNSYDSSTFTDLNSCLDGYYAYINQKNCYDSVFDIILRSRTIVIGIAAGISGVLVLLIILASVLCRQKN